MQTKKDLYQAHRLMQQRLGMALLQAEPDVPESPLRRQNIAMFGGILVAVLIMAVFGIWGLVSPGGATKLTEAGQLLVEKETGAKYVYSQKQSRLLPVANYVSARLILDTPDVKTRSVASASLDELARGPLVGIQGLPDSLPPRDKLVKAPWSVCVVDGPDPAGGVKQYTTMIGGIDVGGRPVGAGVMVVMDDHGQKWAIWNNQRMRINDSGVSALNAKPRKVPASWLNAVKVGVDFAGPKVPERGKKVRGPDGKVTAIVGQVFKVPSVTGGPSRWYVLLPDGLAAITETQALLLLEDPATKKAYGNRSAQPIQIDAASANASPSRQQIAGAGLPETLPKAMTLPATAPLCSVYGDTLKGSFAARITGGSSMALPIPASSGGQDRVDQILLPPGTAVVAGQLPGDGQLGSITTYFLISDQGVRYPLQSGDQIAKLGFEAGDVAPVPSNLLQQIPTGPVLDPAAALSPLAVASR
ncbi:type VII secretion protein EccB [Nonomuraea endophytica]|uniref:type VII secretion protein EccB n=1 Tax=Nonomuraea endophytica TaxID=714136 RepID=UPI0037C7F27F